MTNETTASQPKSIGDDAQFLDWLKAWSHEYENRLRDSDVDDITKQVAAYIDSRAPAAQASATIQAAPDLPPLPEPEEMDGARWGYTADQMRAHGEDCRAATIQEPVMVAEPVGQAQPIAAGWTKFADQVPPEHTQIFWRHGKDAGTGYFMEEDKADWVGEWMFPFAAPMVADPAGVAVPDLSKLPRFKATSGYYERTVALENHSAGDLVKFSDIVPLAATVKAVPSEALEGCEHCLHTYCLSGEICTFCGDVNGMQGYKGGKIAAPLADKKGGGE